MSRSGFNSITQPELKAIKESITQPESDHYPHEEEHECILDVIVAGYTRRIANNIPLEIVDIITGKVKASFKYYMDILQKEYHNESNNKQYSSSWWPRPGPYSNPGLHSILGNLSVYHKDQDLELLSENDEQYLLSCDERGNQLWDTHNVYKFIKQCPTQAFITASQYCNRFKVHCCFNNYVKYFGKGSFIDEMIRLSYSHPNLARALIQSAREYFAGSSQSNQESHSIQNLISAIDDEATKLETLNQTQIEEQATDDFHHSITNNRWRSTTGYRIRPSRSPFYSRDDYQPRREISKYYEESKEVEHECIMDTVVDGYTRISKIVIPTEIVNIIKNQVKTSRYIRYMVEGNYTESFINSYADYKQRVIRRKTGISRNLRSILGSMSYYHDIWSSGKYQTECHEFLLSSWKGKALWVDGNVTQFIKECPVQSFFIATKYSDRFKVYCCYNEYEMYFGKGSFMDEIFRISYSDPAMVQALAQSAKEYFAGSCQNCEPWI